MLSLRFLVIVSVACVSPCDGNDHATVAHLEALARVVQAAYTTDLPAIDRVEVLALSLDDQDDNAPKAKAEAFLVRPASEATADGSVTLGAPEISAVAYTSRSFDGRDAERISDNWRSLDFKPNGAFCHVPAYGLRFYRDDMLLFSVSICWECRNFYMPAIDPHTGRPSVILYGFNDNAAAKKLPNELRRLVPHPDIKRSRQR